ncbi:dissimilatory sulfite reductase (desulfoviridin), alpha/beta subunit [Desulfosporosinus acidiphilus SJ4]|uniref:Dissimilatory sulfite reductase (Desulfoviridin), alpha/beta subunit n=1 Tax=Desulfosporosinus acidiphilus (strain DSM 22704 / JCM 16185 / SJ4) TaxID=646529 RepID=I4D1H9_DESAJ|nr:NIL domain-containing protein [Desulfosporosinus acidiphilus]AFM39653.1 dissimilatory sulfite reductase (desulfoviridin), alpha/beta subunit [Desulfosporosinus acidiphilus SJ4]
MAPKRIVLRFGTDISVKPIVYRLVKDFDLVVNIVKADVNPQKEGTMVLEVTGEQSEEGLAYLRGLGVSVEDLRQGIVRNEEKCVMCGACTGLCPTGALYLERPSMEVHFDEDQCIVCMLCTKICPMRAMEVHL